MDVDRYGKLPPHVAYAVPAAVIGLSLYASTAPSPLYGSYAALWGFSTAVLTLIYATYAIGVLVALLLAGRLSDDIGRRPVLIAALIGIMASTILFAVADSVVWLFFARAVQGLATGLALSAAGAALFDLHPRRDPVSAGRVNGVSSAAGPALGIIVSAALVQFAPAPRVLPYAVEFVLLVIVLIGTLLLKEPISKAPGARVRLTPQRPGIHPDARRPFLLAALAVTASWSLLGLYLSLGPALATDLLHTRSLFASGAVVCLLPCAAAVLQLAFGKGTPWLGAALGALGLALGVILLISAAAISSSILFVVATVISGAGFGATFLGGLRALSAAVPHEHRATVMSAFYIVAYLALSVPAIVAGFLASAIGLAATFEILGGIITAIALIVAVEAWRTRPDQAAIEAAEMDGSDRGSGFRPPAQEGGSLVRGFVGRPDGVPATGAVLTLIDAQGHQIGRAHAGADGRYELPTPGAGTYVLVAAAEGHDPRASTLVVGDRPVDFDPILAGSTGLTGLVRDPHGEPVAGARLVVTDLSGEIVATGTTGADGEYAISWLPSGAYTLTISAAAHRPTAIPVELNGGRTRKDIELPSGARIGGTIQAENRGPLPDARVVLVDAAGKIVGVTTTGPDGTYAFGDLTGGHYTITASGYPPVATVVVLDGQDEKAHDVWLSQPTT